MKLSKKCEYAIKTLMELALSAEAGVRNLRDLSSQTDVPIKFLEQIMMDLKRAGWVISTRGKNGGYVLSADPKKVTLSSVLQRIDGERGSYRSDYDEACLGGSYGGLYECLHDLQNQYYERLDEITLWHLCEKSKILREKISKDVMYYI